MNQDSKHHDEEEIIELTEVFDEDQPEEDLDQELKDFLSGAEDEDFRTPAASGERESQDMDSDLDSFFDHDEADAEMSEDWTFRNDQESRDTAFQETDLELGDGPEEEDTEETAELESMFADLEQNQGSAFQKETLEDRLRETSGHQDLLERFEGLESRISLLSEKIETLENERQALQETGPAKNELKAEISELSGQVESLKRDHLELLESKPSHSDLDELKARLREELLNEIRKAVPGAAAEIIREEIERMRKE
ncbi:MAG: hypothetical protein K9K64_01115 [Desulfohalobiaceae bacterium]|nr:hypothetical protein [Desulfohalobiaceae bacterium]